MTDNKVELLKPSEAAELLHVSPITIRHWAQEGILKSFTTPGGHRRFKKDDVLALIDSSENFISRKKTTVLIVDDEELFSQLLTDVLETLFPSIFIVVAKNGFQAGELIHKIKPHIVMLDLFMPGLDGFSVCKYIKENETTKNIAVIAMTGMCTEENIERILEMGADSCIAKPINFKQLKEIFEQLSKKYEFQLAS